MYYNITKYFVITVILLILYTLFIQQAIEQGRIYHAKQDYLIEAALLAYNPLLKITSKNNGYELANQQLLTTLNFAQFYDFLIKANTQQTNNSLGKLLGSINDKLDTTPYIQQQQRIQIKYQIACHLLARKQQRLIPTINEIMPTYLTLQQPLKLLLDKQQINSAWQKLQCH